MSPNSLIDKTFHENESRYKMGGGVFPEITYFRLVPKLTTAQSGLLEASNGLPVYVGGLIFIPCIICIWPYPMVSKHWILLYSFRSEGRSKVFGVIYA